MTTPSGAAKDSGDQGAKTVFGAPDQQQMISRIDSAPEDDLESSFFSNSIQDAEDAAVRMFDIGVRTLTDEASAPMAAFGTRPAEPAAVPPAADQPVAPGAVGRFEDPLVRYAFILDGPGALDS